MDDFRKYLVPARKCFFIDAADSLGKNAEHVFVM